PTRRRIIWEKDSESSEQIVVQVKSNQVTVTGPDHQKVVVRGKSGNGHKIAKKRALNDSERTKIRKFFWKKNGIIEEDELKNLCDDVSIFQVTGYVSLLHRLVASGTMKLPDQKIYEKHILERRNLWATYDSPKYKALRSMLTKGT
ncbi:MAG: hypothetical protein QW828_05815, partial [Candidatus Bathyarchaeia archaeon]